MLKLSEKCNYNLYFDCDYHFSIDLTINDCDYHFSIDLTINENPFGAKAIGKV